MRAYQNQESIALLLLGLQEKDTSIVSVAADSLYQISKNKHIDKSTIHKIDKNIDRIARYGYMLHIIKSHLKLNQNSILILDHIDNDLKDIIPILLKLGTLENPEIPLETYIQYFLR